MPSDFRRSLLARAFMLLIAELDPALQCTQIDVDQAIPEPIMPRTPTDWLTMRATDNSRAPRRGLRTRSASHRFPEDRH
jgi:hypothetical protein